MKSIILRFLSKVKNWWSSLPKWKKIVIVLTILVALGLLAWWIISINATVATGITGAGNVYVMNDGTATKIGLTARDVAIRANEISIYAPGTEIIGSIKVDNMLEIEKLAHSNFSSDNISSYLGSREWFTTNPDKAMDYLNSI